MVQEGIDFPVTLDLAHVQLDRFLIPHITKNITQIAVEPSPTGVTHGHNFNIFELSVGLDVGYRHEAQSDDACLDLFHERRA